MQHLYYYKLEEAEQLRSTYASWIGKEAHVGKGMTDRLKAIKISTRREFVRNIKSEKYYKVEFEFETRKHFSAHEFLINNNLIPIYEINP